MGLTADVTLPGDCEVRLTRAFAATHERLFECFTDPQWLTRWLGPEGFDFAVCENDAAPGKRYRWLWRNAQGDELGMRGEYLKVERPCEILRTEIFDQGLHRSETIGWLRISEVPSGAQVTISVLFPTREARDLALAGGMDRGMAASLERLDLLLAVGREAVSPSSR